MLKIIFAIILCYFPLNYAQVESELFLEGAPVTDISSEDGDIWISTYGKGIFNYQRKEDKWIQYSSQNSKLLDNDLFFTVAADKNFIWAGATDGLFIYDKKRKIWKKRKFSQGGEFGNWIRTLRYDSKSKILWIGRFRNLTYLDVKRQRYKDIDLTQKDDSKTNNFKSIEFDGDSIIYFGTENGYHTFNKKKKIEDKSAWNYINNKSKNAFKNEGEAVSIEDFAFDKSSVWFATDEFVTEQQPDFNPGGVYKFDRKLKWDRYSMLNGLSANGVYSLERTGNKIWAGLYSFDKNEKKEYGKGLAVIDRITGKVEMIDLNQLNIKSASITTMFFDGEFLWIGSDKGLVRLKISSRLAQWDGKKPKRPAKK